MTRHRQILAATTRLTAAVAAAVACVVVLGASAAAAQSGAQPPVPVSPPGLGPAGTSTVHGDAASTDTLPGRGPGATPAIVGGLTGATCSTVFVGSDGMPVALCTSYVGLNPPTPLAPTVKLLHPDTAAVLAEVQLAKGALLGGVYGYLDDRDRVVVADGNRRLLAVGHHRDPDGTWRMTVEVMADLTAAVPPGDAVTGLTPAFDGRVWFATSGGVVGTVRPGDDGVNDDDDELRTLALPAGEKITNGLTARPGGASVITTRALYEIDVEADGTPVVRWRHGYEVGPARKPGLLAHGSGTTPTYFGPDDSLVAITDDADQPDLIVLRRDDGSQVCRMPAFATTLAPDSVAPDGVLIEGPAATENSIIAFSGALVLVNTYGFEYPPFAVDGPAVPASAPYTGGMTRIDVRADGAGDADGSCGRAWTSLTRTASLPKLTTGDGHIHALAYGPPGAHPALDHPALDHPLLAQGLAQKFGPVDVTSTDVETGREVMRGFVGHAPLDEPMELTGTIVSRGDAPGVMWQPTLTRMLRIGPP
ncbi:hypothetical protein [Rhodococcus sp. IEGM 1408]|uniref:hypothetical protein n=1 Tax=Rhodococcus sp. IEGM 1408 TaxID=3082220 RepID=UPI002953A328|nr:hypothetical protein [Rhodococcus sp. IEGM 1408]MDV8002211.1 hypothetical protein [Rhodococcus sp. IEGM 1408]